jgi:adenylate cyclase class IV
MEKTTEVELKFEILDPQSLHNFLSKLQSQHSKRVKDVYLDTKDGQLYQRGIFLRIRNNKTLDFKFNLKEISRQAGEKLDHFHVDEYNFELPIHENALPKLNEVSTLLGLKTVKRADLEEFKKVNHLVNSIIIDRERTTYKGEKFTVMTDDVENLGKYLEVEYVAQAHEKPEAIRLEMQDFLKYLQAKEINVGYCELYWRKHNFELYLKGKFLLDEDYIKYRKWC